MVHMIGNTILTNAKQAYTNTTLVFLTPFVKPIAAILCVLLASVLLGSTTVTAMAMLLGLGPFEFAVSLIFTGLISQYVGFTWIINQL